MVISLNTQMLHFPHNGYMSHVAEDIYSNNKVIILYIRSWRYIYIYIVTIRWLCYTYVAEDIYSNNKVIMLYIQLYSGCKHYSNHKLVKSEILPSFITNKPNNTLEWQWLQQSYTIYIYHLNGIALMTNQSIIQMFSWDSQSNIKVIIQCPGPQLYVAN